MCAVSVTRNKIVPETHKHRHSGSLPSSLTVLSSSLFSPVELLHIQASAPPATHTYACLKQRQMTLNHTVFVSAIHSCTALLHEMCSQ